MSDNVLTYLRYGNSFCGIEHTNQGDAIFYATLLHKSKKELHVTSFLEGKSIEDISKELPKHQHIVLVINDNKVLSKTIESEQQEPEKLVYKAFPNINVEEFYFEVLSQNNKHFIALCRKDYIDAIIKQYAKEKLLVIDVSLGNSTASTLASFVKKDNVYTSNASIQIENHQIIQIKKDTLVDETYDINGLTVARQYLLSFSGALRSVLQNNTTETNFLLEKTKWLNEFKHTRFFNQFLKWGGVFILGLLLINFFLFNRYFNKVNELRQVSQINLSNKDQIIKLDEIVTKKQKMVDDLLKSDGSKSSFYCDRITQSLPKTILLYEFNYQPLLKRIKAGKDIELKYNNIVVSGTSSNSNIFSYFIKQLEDKPWIAKVAIMDYGAMASNTSNFKINIILNDQ